MVHYAKMSKHIEAMVHLHSIIIDVTDGTGHRGISTSATIQRATRPTHLKNINPLKSVKVC
jgi:hypothetical protein